ncbi:hypothetical protein [Williamsia sp. CHRR-6]|uniref:hypothetical protein n=1 Tax=Williamsia sp. CHRR-6 TaxID=2835871 RepID=UPI001BDA9FB0|nr:hypothetical protein [Williamsia sp. CHRR-6]MBT0565811.1 hypothetical protein [Williamsia sp. CHRR-6]
MSHAEIAAPVELRFDAVHPDAVLVIDVRRTLRLGPGAVTTRALPDLGPCDRVDTDSTTAVAVWPTDAAWLDLTSPTGYPFALSVHRAGSSSGAWVLVPDTTSIDTVEGRQITDDTTALHLTVCPIRSSEWEADVDEVAVHPTSWDVAASRSVTLRLTSAVGHHPDRLGTTPLTRADYADHGVPWPHSHDPVRRSVTRNERSRSSAPVGCRPRWSSSLPWSPPVCRRGRGR